MINKMVSCLQQDRNRETLLDFTPSPGSGKMVIV